ncbi:hypothetical protein ACJX0J_002902 (mitochondrion) [Zea mays]
MRDFAGPNGNTVGFTECGIYSAYWQMALYYLSLGPHYINKYEIDELPLNQFNQEKTLQESVKLFVLIFCGVLGKRAMIMNTVEDTKKEKSQYDNLNYLMQKRWFLARDAHLILINGTRELDSKKGLDQRSMMVVTTERGKGQPLDRTPKTAPAGVDKKPFIISKAFHSPVLISFSFILIDHLSACTFSWTLLFSIV